MDRDRDRIIINGFLNELEKTAGPSSALFKSFKKGVEVFAKNYGEKHFVDYSKLKLGKTIAGPKHKPMLGFKEKNPIAVGEPTVGIYKRLWQESGGDWKKTVAGIPKAVAGQFSQNIKLLDERGPANFFKHYLNEARTYRQIGKDGKQYIYKRSLPGQVAAAGMMSNVGWAGHTMVGYKDPTTGQKRPIANRALTSAGILVSPSVFGTYDILRDAPKLLNKNN